MKSRVVVEDGSWGEGKLSPLTKIAPANVGTKHVCLNSYTNLNTTVVSQMSTHGTLRAYQRRAEHSYNCFCIHR